MPAHKLRLFLGIVMLALLGLAQKVPPDIGRGWLPEFDHAASQLNALADVIPAEKFGWRPAPGIRSVGEVYMHVAIANDFLLAQAGVKLPPDLVPQLKPDTERTVTGKPQIVKWLKDSQQLVRDNYFKIDPKKKVAFFGNDTNADGVLLRLLVHNHEHMGQLIAYARSIGVAPPWSQAAGN